MKPFDLSGKRALITGSTQGIGKAAAACLVQNGAQVIVHGRSRDKCLCAVRDTGAAGFALADLSREESCGNLYQETGPVDILILNASVQIQKPWEEITGEDCDIQLQTNFKSSFRLIQLYAADMERKGWGRIITVGSVQQTRPHKEMPIYAATKEAQMSLVKNLAKQLAPKGITVNNLSPGVMDTPRNERALSDPIYSRQVLEGIPCGFAGSPEDCASAFLLLCSREGRYITGIDLVVDGGMHL